MPRCAECSKIVVPNCDGQRILQELRKWISGHELIMSAETGCDVCCFFRKYLGKASMAHMRGTFALQEHHNKISLICNHWPHKSIETQLSLRLHPDINTIQFYIGPGAAVDPFSSFASDDDPVLRACQLFQDCALSENETHVGCKPVNLDPSRKASSLPRRLLDLSHENEIVTIDVQLWIAAAYATIDELSNYCTLSYRWGKGPPDCMLREEFTRDRVLSFASMPQTFQDAVIVARGLGIRFIWIDALCIVQPSAHGNHADWNVEGPRMWLVYQNAMCTISATCSRDPNDGFLHKVGIDCMKPCDILQQLGDGTRVSSYLHPKNSAFRFSVIPSALNRRGWVAQERLLSRRLLHFTEEGVFRECLQSDLDMTPFLDSLPEGRHHASHMTFGNWLSFIEFYSKSSFTNHADRLIALSSIAKSVPLEQFGERYLAGIWEAHLLQCLSWYSRDPCSVTSRASYLADAPSWSWASVPGRVDHSFHASREPLQNLAELEDVSLLLAQAGNPYGNLKRGALKLRARPDSMSQFGKGDRVDVKITWDEQQDYSATVNRMYTVVPLRAEHDSEHLVCNFNALIVAPVPAVDEEGFCGSSTVYRRIGYMEASTVYRRIGYMEGTHHAQLMDGDTPVPWMFVRPTGPHLSYEKLFPDDATLETIVIV